MLSATFLFTEIPNAPDENKWRIIEQYIDSLLLQSGGTQLPDSGLSFLKRLEWQAYRDNLRSIQDDFANPDDVIFPTPPAEE